MRSSLQFPKHGLKSPFYSPLGERAGMYRVGPLARLLVSERCSTPQADREGAEFLETYGEARISSFFYHYARLIEILYACEHMEGLLNEPDIMNADVYCPHRASSN